MTKPLICFAHRGASAQAPENTLKAVRAALALQCDWIEIDVQRAGSELVVIHDRRLMNPAGASRLITDMPFEALRALDAGRGERIPTLREVFDCVSGRAGINVEIKSEGCVEAVASLIREYAPAVGAERFLVSSFNHQWLRQLRDTAPEIPVGALITGIPQDLAACAQRLDARSIHPDIDFVNRELVQDAHRRGLSVFVYTVNLPEDFDLVRELGVDGVFTDRPERARPTPAD